MIMMTTIQAINKAMRAFKAVKPLADIRSIFIMEGSGDYNKGLWRWLSIQIEYINNGDYTESDKDPFIIKVYASDNRKEE